MSGKAREAERAVEDKDLEKAAGAGLLDEPVEYDPYEGGEGGGKWPPNTFYPNE